MRLILRFGVVFAIMQVQRISGGMLASKLVVAIGWGSACEKSLDALGTVISGGQLGR